MAAKGTYTPLHSAKDKGKQPKYVPLDLSTDEETEENTNRRFLSGRRRYYVAGFAVVLIISVVTVAAVLGTKTGEFSQIHCSFDYAKCISAFKFLKSIRASVSQIDSICDVSDRAP